MARPVALTPKAFSVLHHLARHAGRLVTKEEFLDVVWPGVFVGDAALKVCVREIRKAIGEDPQVPTYIQTVHRRGYRFVAPVTLVTAPRSDAPLVHDAPADTVGAADAGRERGPPPRRPPPTRYARSGDISIAYQVLGEGPIDLVFVMGWVSHLDYFWREPSFARFLTRLASFSRLILFDKRGTGLSDRVNDLPTLEQRMDDVRAVMEAVGSERAALMGVSEGGPLCSLFAATYPERTLGAGDDRHLRAAAVGARLSLGRRRGPGASASSRRSAAAGAARWASRCARRAGPTTPRSASGGAPTCAWAPAPARR